MTGFPSHLLWVKARRQTRMWRREERGARLGKMVREGNRRNEILTGIDEKIFICIARLFLIVVVCVCKCKVKQYAANQQSVCEK